MGFKDKLRKAQGGNAVSLDVAFRFHLKTIEGKPSFVYYDKASGSEKATTKSIEGIYIGSAMRLTAFSQDLGSKGNKYFSRPYWSLDNISLFAPSRVGRSKLVATGDMDEITSFLNINAKGNMQKKKLLYIGTEGGLVMIETNMSIAIDQLKSFEKDTFNDFMMLLKPMLYSAENKDISSKCKTDILGSFALKNPPTYASIHKGKPITDELVEKMKAESMLDQFLAWKEFVLSNKAAGGDDAHEADTEEERQDAPAPGRSQPGKVSGEDLLEPEDDLPF